MAEAQGSTQSGERLVVKFGNPAPLHQYEVDGERVAQPARHLNQSVTRVDFADYVRDHEFVTHTLSTDNDPILSMIARVLGEDSHHAVAINELLQIINAHVAGGLKPTWVSSNDSEVARVIGKFFGCRVSEFKPDDEAGGDPYSALLTNGGRDVLHQNGYTTGAQAAAFNYVGLTANNVAAAAADTTLTGEITTAGGGLIRKQGTYAHTAGTNTTTITVTFTANGSDALPVTVAKIGIFNAATAGTMGHETLLNATATLTISGDSVTVTDTVTLG